MARHRLTTKHHIEKAAEKLDAISALSMGHRFEPEAMLTLLASEALVHATLAAAAATRQHVAWLQGDHDPDADEIVAAQREINFHTLIRQFVDASALIDGGWDIDGHQQLQVAMARARELGFDPRHG